MGRQRMPFVFLLLQISIMCFLQAQSSNLVEIRGLFLAFRTNSNSVITVLKKHNYTDKITTATVPSIPNSNEDMYTQTPS